MKLILLGPPGAGKGTQAVRLAAHWGVPQVSTGDIMREARRAKTKLGLEVEKYMLSGKLVPDSIVTDLVRERLGGSDTAPGFILDGFPRTLGQAESLETLLGSQKRPIDCVLNLEVPEAALVQRLLGRGREDDTEAVIRDRLRVYREQTEPLIQYYTAKGSLVNIAGLGSMEEVFGRLVEGCRHG